MLAVEPLNLIIPCSVVDVVPNSRTANDPAPLSVTWIPSDVVANLLESPNKTVPVASGNVIVLSAVGSVTVKCVSKLLNEAEKEILGLSVVVELGQLNAKNNLNFPVMSQIIL